MHREGIYELIEDETGTLTDPPPPNKLWVRVIREHNSLTQHGECDAEEECEHGSEEVHEEVAGEQDRDEARARVPPFESAGQNETQSVEKKAL